MDERTTDAPSYHTFQHVNSIQARVIVPCPGSDPTHDVNDVMSEG